MAGHIAAAGTEPRPTSRIIQDIVSSIGEIVRAELRLARVEVSEKAQSAGRAAGLLAGGIAVMALSAALFVVACVAALALIMPLWVAAIIMGLILLAAGGFMAIVGRDRLRQVNPRPEQTIHTLKEDAAWLKQQTR